MSKSHLNSLNRLDLNFEERSEDASAKQALMAKSQLDDAQVTVIREAQVGLAEAKKDITSFIEADYDLQHLGKVTDTLISVRGAASLLGLNQAKSVLNSCINFVNANLERDFSAGDSEGILDTMADALIALEYYLFEIETYGESSPTVLQVAEQSLTSLGFPVDSQN